MTKKAALTQWFKKTDPVNEGVYEVQFIDKGIGFSRFEGGVFHFIGFTDMLSRKDAFNYAIITHEKHDRDSIVRWRGLASNSAVKS